MPPLVAASHVWKQLLAGQQCCRPQQRRHPRQMCLCDHLKDEVVGEGTELAQSWDMQMQYSRDKMVSTLSLLVHIFGTECRCSLRIIGHLSLEQEVSGVAWWFPVLMWPWNVDGLCRCLGTKIKHFFSSNTVVHLCHCVWWWGPLCQPLESVYCVGFKREKTGKPVNQHSRICQQWSPPSRFPWDVCLQDCSVPSLIRKGRADQKSIMQLWISSFPRQDDFQVAHMEVAGYHNCWAVCCHPEALPSYHRSQLLQQSVCSRSIWHHKR